MPTNRKYTATGNYKYRNTKNNMIGLISSTKMAGDKSTLKNAEKITVPNASIIIREISISGRLINNPNRAAANSIIPRKRLINRLIDINSTFG